MRREPHENEKAYPAKPCVLCGKELDVKPETKKAAHKGRLKNRNRPKA